MRTIIRFLKDYKKESILSPLFKLLEACFELFVPLIVASIIDNGISNADTSYIIKMCLLLALLGAVGLAVAISAQYFAAKAAVGVATKMRSSLFKHINSFSFSQLDQLGVSTLITRMTGDINSIQGGVNTFLRLLLRSPFIVFGAMIMAFTVDYKAALIFVVVIPLLFVIVAVIMGICIKLYKKAQNSLDNVLLRIEENLTGVRVIRAFCRKKEEKDDFQKQNNALYKLQKTAGVINSVLNPATLVIINIAIIILIWTGAIRVQTGVISVGAVVALYNYMSQILVELIKFATMIVNVSKALASANRVEAVFDIVPDDNHIENNCSSDSFIEYRNVDLRYTNSSANSLTNINVKINKGETIGVIGGTGSGKSSLINLLTGFYPATRGEVIVDNKNILSYTQDELANKVTIAMQKSVLFNDTIKNNILWGNKNATDEEIAKALEISSAKDFVGKKEQGIEALISENGSNLSGGQKQRLSIARAIISKPQILILDDSFSALDYKTDLNLRTALKENLSNTTVIIVSQRISSIIDADKILVLSDGKIVGQGKHNELLSNCDEYAEIYSLQSGKEVS